MPLQTNIMKRCKYFGQLLIVFIFCSCSKSGSELSSKVVGTWAFTNQFGQSFSYPSILQNPFPFSVSNWSISVDSVKVSFDNTGSYSFSNFRLPIDRGTYSIVQDSLLVIKPDTAGLIKFCYSTPTLTAGTGIPPVAIPYSNFRFSSDTILFTKTSDNKLVFTTFWLSKAAQPLQPGLDTIIINKAVSYFKQL